MSIEKRTSWETYEDVARLLLDKIGDALGLGLESIEGKQTLVGASGTKWEIDAKGVSADGEAVVVIECRRYPKSSLKQSDMAALAWTINDLGASGGIVVTLSLDAGGYVTEHLVREYPADALAEVERLHAYAGICKVLRNHIHDRILRVDQHPGRGYGSAKNIALNLDAMPELLPGASPKLTQAHYDSLGVVARGSS
ncbi:hypothetical protein [Mycobacteroides salmoniphilum]|uniref:hypothetical protein n=1 Tax=Mycobacteroides salmoniphilum TaxID=404941 RepID=UPI0009924753|nr:hypothetical protein [Mycobacteroides salmoniphilum]QCH23412.1 hypothetical protein DSM43276_01671 [Mycobacteroides salmoniphilum]